VLTSQGRAVGINIILCTQHSSADVLPGWIKTNMVLRIAGKMPSFHASMTILDSATAASLPDNVGRMVFALGRYEVIAQTPFISDEEIARSVEISQAFSDPDNREFEARSEEGDTEEVIPLVAKPKFTREDLIKLALERFNGKLTATHIHALLGNEIVPLRKLRQMIDSLIEEREIRFQGKVYGLKKDRSNYVLVEHPNADDLSNAKVEGRSDVRSESEIETEEENEGTYPVAV
jgi:DNA segregation ATPase FtsK/SpoIIIE-like protein